MRGAEVKVTELSLSNQSRKLNSLSESYFALLRAKYGFFDVEQVVPTPTNYLHGVSPIQSILD